MVAVRLKNQSDKPVVLDPRRLVPIDGKVTDPYPFKVLIGKDNLTANGIQLPDVEGAIVSGTATGDWTLSCVMVKSRNTFQLGCI